MNYRLALKPALVGLCGCSVPVPSTHLSGAFTDIAVSGPNVFCGMVDEGNTLACATYGELWVPPAPPAIAVSGGGGLNCAVFDDGATCWISDDVAEPVRPGWIAGEWTAMRNDHDTACVSDEGGRLTCRGLDLPEAVPFSSFEVYGTICGLVVEDGTIRCYPDGDLPAPALAGSYDSFTVAYPEVCGLSGGEVTCSGSDAALIPPAEAQFRQIGAEEDRICGIEDAGGILCWGDPEFVSINGDVTMHSNIIDDQPTTGTYTALSVDYDTACAINADGCIVCWGGWESYRVSEDPDSPTVDHPLCPSDFDRMAPIPNWIVGIP